MDLLELAKLCAAVVVASTFAWVALIALRHNQRTAVIYILALLPLLFIYLYAPYQRVYASHGLMHISFVYELMRATGLPESPVFAGEPLLYAWAHHYLVARGVEILGVSPAWVFAGLNIFALLATIAALRATARYLSGEPAILTLAVLLSLYGITAFDLEARAIPVVGKFANVNSMPLGIAFFTLFVACATAMLKKTPVGWPGWIGLPISLVGAAFFYPLVSVALVASACAAGAYLFFAQQGQWRRRAVGYFVTLFFAGLCALPYFYLISHGKQGPPVLSLDSLSSMLAKTGKLVIIVAPVLVLGVLFREALSRCNQNVLRMLSGMAAVNMLMYLLLRVPTGSEYKFLMLFLLLSGIIVSQPVHVLTQKHRGISFILLAALLLPFADYVLHKSYINWHRGVAHNFYEEGKWLRHADPEQDSLYRWLMSNTRIDAVVVDNSYTVPVFAHRATYIAINHRPARALPDGFQRTRSLVRNVLGHSEEDVQMRMRVMQQIYGPDNDSGSAFMDTLSPIATERCIFIVARDSETAARLQKVHGLHSVYQSITGNAEVYAPAENPENCVSLTT